MSKLCLKDFDAYGFDLDHTLAKYNLVNQIQLTYNSLVDFLVHQRGCKGLFVDTEQGNIIKLSHSGKILRGSHGMGMLSQEELVSAYGPNLIWEHYEHAREAVRARADWKSYFDIIVTNARKPGFFQDQKPFLSLDGVKEHEVVDYNSLQQHGVYSSGNHSDLEKFISKLTGADKPKVVYFGDSLCSDAFPVKTLTNWDLILVLEEMEAEGYHPHDNTHHYWEPEERDRKIVRNVNLCVDEEEEAYLLSQQWGSFFYHPEADPLHDRHMNTFWGELITKYTDIAIPSMEYIAGLPLDHQFTRFDHSVDGSTDGFSPAKPKPLLPLVLSD
ncbi:NT5D1-like protein [Mya arenaria]|uniref:NT5D1-like protein n=1 Tax=Mya arenaria TaxID=6604 RepID=A0ABY7EKM2_MYAAR|nr:NT5D1-like protein [Mya arenaria]